MYKLKIKHLCVDCSIESTMRSRCIVLVPCCLKYRQVHAHTTVHMTQSTRDQPVLPVLLLPLLGLM